MLLWLVVLVVVLLVSVSSALRIAPNTLALNVPTEISMNTLESAQYTFTVKDMTVTTPLYFFALPCVGRFDLFLNQGAPASRDAKLNQISWKDGKDTTFAFLSVPKAALDTVFYVQLKAYEQAVNSTLFASARVVVTLDKDFVSKQVNPIPSDKALLTGEVIDEKASLKVTFHKAPASAGAKDAYQVFTKTGAIGDPVKEPFNGCSLPTLMQEVASPNFTDVDGDKLTFTVNNTYRKDGDPPFSVAVRLCRTPASAGYTWCTAYPILSVCEGAACPKTGRAAAAALAPSPLLVAFAALLASCVAAAYSFN
jgi:hypothetical protein